jgi:glycosyltransferase involved in cell wall biosynthesis
MRPKATVIIPTFGEAGFSRWAIRSVQEQTVADIEICIVCDGSSERMLSFFASLAKEDPRVRVFSFPKAPRTGEPYRHVVIGQTTAPIICYCGHDDLWLPSHVEELAKTLRRAPFTHSIHAWVNLPEEMADEQHPFSRIFVADLRDPKIREDMLIGINHFGLTFGAHTRKAYRRLDEPWVTTPVAGMATDLYMWQKFLTKYPKRCRTTPKITALSFPRTSREDWSDEKREDELARWYERMQDPGFSALVETRLAEVLPPRPRTVRERILELSGFRDPVS